MRSAERHLQICKQLLVDYDSLSDAKRKSYLIAEVYYLSGYILESSLSYAFFSHIRYSGDIYLSEHYKNNGFKTHDIRAKYHYMNKQSCFIHDLVFVSRAHTSKELQNLFNDWNVNYRYEHYSNLDKTLIISYINEIEQDLVKIKTNYPS